MQPFPVALPDLEEARLGAARDAVGHRRFDRGGGFRRACQRGVGDLPCGAGRDRQRRRPVRIGQAVGDERGLAPAGRRQRGIGLALEPALDDVVQFAVADEHEGRVQPVGDAQPCARVRHATRSLPRRMVHRSMTASRPRMRVLDRLRHVVVEGQDHERVLARSRASEVHRADVDVRLAEHRPDPPHHPRSIVVAGDEQHVGRPHVEAIDAEPGDPGLAAGHRPADGDRPASRVARQRELRRERPGVRGLALHERDAAGLGERPGVDEVDPLGRDRLEQAAQGARDERRAVVLGKLARDLQRQRAHAAARELGEEPAEDLGQRQVGGDGTRGLGRQQGGVDRVARAAPVEDVDDLRGDLLGDEDLRLDRRGPEVRRQQRVRCGEQRRIGRRLLVEDVDPGAAEVSRREGLGDRGLVDDPAARDVEDDGPGLHLRDGVATDQPARGAGERHVHGDDVRAGQERVEIDEVHAVVGGLLGGHVRVDAQHHHVHRAGTHRDRLPDLAEPDDPERSATQFEAGELAALPLATSDRGVGRGDPARDAVQQGQRVLGRRDRVPGRGVDDRDPGPRRRVEVDVVHADARRVR